jgi:hypothetical protein
LNCSVSGTAAVVSGGNDDLRVGQRGERALVGGPLRLRYADRDQRLARGRPLAERTHGGHHGRGLEEREPAVAVVVGEGAERLRSQRDLRVEPPRAVGVERRHGRGQ